MASNTVTIKALLDTSGVESGVKSVKSAMDSIDSSVDGTSSKTSGLSSKFDALKIAGGNLLSNAVTSAFNAITSSIGDAISRVDTLNQFPKVMQNIGFSAEEADAAMSKMSDGIEGLPTSLDQIVSNTQSLAMSLGDLDLATDVALALNDGFTTFGASSEEVTRAITQLNQMITSGKYDMQSWNSINQAAPGYLDTVAKSILGTEANANQLRDALNDGTVTTEDFTNAMISLDKEGDAANGITAFADSARDASSGIGTSMGNVQTAIVKNLANIIDAINGSGAISSFFDTVKGIINELGNALVPVAEAIGAAIPVIGQVFTDVFSAIAEVVAPAIEEIIGHFQAFAEKLQEIFGEGGTGESVLQTFQAAWEVLSPIVETVFGTISDVIGAALDVISGIIEVFSGILSGDWGLVWQGVQDIVGGVWDAITSVIGGALDALGSLITTGLDAIAGFWGSIWQGISDFLGGIFENIVNAIVPGGMDTLKAFIEDPLGTISGIWQQAWDSITEFVGNAWDNITQGVSDGINGVLDFITGIPQSILDTLGDLGSLLLDAGGQIISGLLDGLKGAIDGVWDFVGGIGDTIASLKGPKSYDLQLLVENGNWIMDSLLAGLEEGEIDVTSMVSFIPDEMLSAIGNVTNLLSNAGQQIISSLLSGLQSSISSVYSFVSSIGSTIASLKGPKQYDLKLLVPNGNWIMDSLVSGLEEGESSLISELSEITSLVADTSFDDFAAGIDASTVASNTGMSKQAEDANTTMLGKLDDIISGLADLAGQQTIINLDGNTIARGIASASDTVSGARQTLAARGVAV